mgnify:CR=1 FL=1
MFGYSVDKARTHVMSTVHNPSGWNTDVYVYEIRRVNDAGYAIQLEDIFRYSHAVCQQSRQDMLNDALDTTRYGRFKKGQRKIHETTVLHCSPTIEFASTEWQEDHDVVFANGQHIGGSTFNYRQILMIATIGPVLYPQMVDMAAEFAESIKA